jgi:hypothetical protein
MPRDAPACRPANQRQHQQKPGHKVYLTRFMHHMAMFECVQRYTGPAQHSSAAVTYGQQPPFEKQPTRATYARARITHLQHQHHTGQCSSSYPAQLTHSRHLQSHNRLHATSACPSWAQRRARLSKASNQTGCSIMAKPQPLLPPPAPPSP